MGEAPEEVVVNRMQKNNTTAAGCLYDGISNADPIEWSRLIV